MQHVVDTDENVRSLLGDDGALFNRTKRITKCSGQIDCEARLPIGSRNREEAFKKFSEMTSVVFVFLRRQKRLAEHAVDVDAISGVFVDS